MGNANASNSIAGSGTVIPKPTQSTAGNSILAPRLVGKTTPAVSPKEATSGTIMGRGLMAYVSAFGTAAVPLRWEVAHERERPPRHQCILDNLIVSLVAFQRELMIKKLKVVSTWNSVSRAVFEAEQILLNPWMTVCTNETVHESVQNVCRMWRTQGPGDQLEAETLCLTDLVRNHYHRKFVPSGSAAVDMAAGAAASVSLKSATIGGSTANLIYTPTTFYRLWTLVGENSHRPSIFVPRILVSLALLGLGVWLLFNMQLLGVGVIAACLLIVAHAELVILHNRVTTGMYRLTDRTARTASMVHDASISIPSVAITRAPRPPPLNIPHSSVGRRPDESIGQRSDQERHKAVEILEKCRQSIIPAARKPAESPFDTVVAADEVDDVRRSSHSHSERLPAPVLAHSNIAPMAPSNGFGAHQSGEEEDDLFFDSGSEDLDDFEDVTDNMTAFVLCGLDIPARVQICEVLWRRGINVCVTDDFDIFMTRANRVSERNRMMLVYADSVMHSPQWPLVQMLGSEHLVYYILRNRDVVPNMVPNNNIVFFPMRNSEVDRLIAILRGMSFVDLDFLKPNRAFHIPQYFLGRRLGGGAFGNVFEVELDITGGRCAVKRMYAKNDENSPRLHEIAREADIMSRLSHPNIVQFLFCQQEEQCVCIFMEICENSLGDYIQNGTIRTATDFRKILREIITAVCYLHSEQLLHRDLKPENVLFRNGVVKLTDFGTAAFKKEELFTNVTGTFPFMAPEVLIGKPYSYPCDVWSIGCLVADMLGVQVDHRLLAQTPLLEYLRAMPLDTHAKVHCDAPCVKKFLCDCLWRDPEHRPEVQTLMSYDLFLPAGEAEIQAILDHLNYQREVNESSFSMISNAGEHPHRESTAHQFVHGV